MENGNKYKFFHTQFCCEVVKVDIIIGDLKSVLNTPIVSFTEYIEDIDLDNEDYDEIIVRTTYSIVTENGTVHIRWDGYSDGLCTDDIYVYYEEV